LRTASVAAGMIVVSHRAAVIALGDVPTQCGRAAQRQVAQRLPDMRTLRPTLQELGTVAAHDLTQVQGRFAGGKRSSGLTTC
jgi:hypothetical protein